MVEIKDQCHECDGRGYFISDNYDHEGNHIQTEFTCEECGGSGIRYEKETNS